MKTTCCLHACVILALCLCGASVSADGVWEMLIRKVGTNVVTSYGYDSSTNESSREFFCQMAPKATNITLNIVLTLGELTFPEAVEAIGKVARPWRGPVYVNISSIAQDGAVVTLSVYSKTGTDVSASRHEVRVETNTVPRPPLTNGTTPLFP